jgi:hypothetical protein
MQMKISISVQYTEADIARLIREDLAVKNLQIVAGDIKFRMTKDGPRYRLLGAEIEVSKPVDELPALVSTCGE